MNATVERKWTTFFSSDKDKIYKRAGLRWTVYTLAGDRNTRSQKYIKSTVLASTLLSLENQLASICQRNSQYTIETCTSWGLSDLDSDKLLYDPTNGPFILVQYAFKAFVEYRQILLDLFVLPQDYCQLITTAISNATAIAVCNG